MTLTSCVDKSDQLLIGLASGDSLGSTSEFLPLDRVRHLLDSKNGWPFKQVGGGAFGWKPGEPTDDTDMAMAIYRALKDSDGQFNPERIIANFIAWYDSHPRDIGATTARLLSAHRSAFDVGYDWLSVSMKQYSSQAAANGSLMRNGIIAGCAPDTLTAMRYAAIQSLITHPAPLPVICCVIQTWIQRRMLDGQTIGDQWQSDAISAVLDWKDRCASEDGVLARWLDTVGSDFNTAIDIMSHLDGSLDYNPYSPNAIQHQGYVLTTLQIGVWALRWALEGVPFPSAPDWLKPVTARTGVDTLAWVACIGRDSDTYGAVAGSLLASKFDLPSYFTDGLMVLRELS